MFNKKRGRFGPRFFMLLAGHYLPLAAHPTILQITKKPNVIKGLTDVSGKK
jgi:hypothetical protein